MTKEELEKEKCRLERKLEQTEKDLADYQFNYPTIKELQEEITEAKEIIREFVEWANWQGNSKCPSFKSIQDKAEQFISEMEK